MHFIFIVLALSAAPSLALSAGEACTSSSECDGTIPSQSSLFSKCMGPSASKRCCAQAVLSSGLKCDGCGTDGMCNLCSSSTFSYSQLNTAKTGCVKKQPGEVCDPDKSECGAGSSCLSPYGSTSPKTTHCCKSTVDYSCDGCGSDGMCNYCSSNSDVSDDKQKCVSSDSNSGGSGGGSGGLVSALDQGGIIAGAIIGSIAVMAIAVPIAIVLSNNAKKAAKAANDPEESSLCCCGRSWATSISVVALSCALLVLIVCFTQTFVAKYLSAMSLLSSAVGTDPSSSAAITNTKLLYYDLPLILTIVAAVFSLGTIVSYRFLSKGIGCCIGVLAIICAVLAAGFGAFIGIYWTLATGGNTMAGGLYTSYILIGFLIFAYAIALIVCIGMHIGRCCCCCKRPDEPAPNFAEAHAVEIGSIEVTDPTMLK